jgi:hypothetical protein
LVIPGTAAITAIRIIPTRIQLRTMIPIIRTRITPIRMLTGRLRNSNSMVHNNRMLLRRTERHNSSSTVLRRTVLRRSSKTALRNTDLRNSSSTVLRRTLRRPRSKPCHSRTRHLATRRRLRNPAATKVRTASGIVSVNPFPNNSCARMQRTSRTLLCPVNFLLLS